MNQLKEMIPEQVLRRPRTEERRRRIEDDRLCARLLHEVFDPVHEPEEVVVAADDGRFLEGTHHLGDMDPAVGEQATQVEAQRVTGGEQVFGRLLDADDDRLQAMASEVRRRLQAEDGLARAAAPRDQCRPPHWQAPERQRIESRDAGLHLCHHAHRLKVTPQDFSRSTSGSAFERSPTT